MPRLCVTLAASLLAAAVASAQQQPPPSFRSRVTLVPVDVRVIGRDGKPVTDLTKEDFTITEDGVRQEIVQFALQSFGNDVAVEDELVSTNRVFLLVLGSGRQVSPVKAVEASMKFVRERLLPQDEVAIIAYNRVTAFTTDHQRILRALERYWKHHEDIEWALTKRTGQIGLPGGGPRSLGGKYGYHDLPHAIQKRIDEIFTGPDALPTRSVFTAGMSNESAIPGFYGSRVDHPGLQPWSLDYLIDAHYGTHIDIANMFAGVRYLRELKGEKHLVFITPEGLELPSVENDRSVASLAADARVAVHFIHTGGIGSTRALAPASWDYGPWIPSINRFAIESLRRVASLTGGGITAFASGDSAFKKIDETTRAQYVLAYAPAQADLDGRFRKIAITVNRKDVQVFYRRGYVARPRLAPVDDAAFRVYLRVASALNMRAVLDDLVLSVRGATAVADPHEVHVQLHVGAKGLQLTQKDGRYVGALQAVYFCGDAAGRSVGEKWHALDFDLTEDTYQRFLAEGLSFTVAVPVTGTPVRVKAVVYDAASDRLGSAFAVVKTNKK